MMSHKTVGVSMLVYGVRYVDDIILRVRDANASGPPEERRYYLTDANYHVVMRVDAEIGQLRVLLVLLKREYHTIPLI